MPILERLRRYALAVHNSDSGAVNALLEIALPIEEARLGIPSARDTDQADFYPEAEVPMLRVAEQAPSPDRKKPRRTS